MDKYFTDIEYFSDLTKTWSECIISGIYGEKSFTLIPKSNNDIKSNSSKNTIVIPIENIRKIIQISSSPFDSSSSEYNVSTNNFAECKIKNQKGNFFSLTLPETKSTILSRANQMRYVSSIPLTNIISDNFTNLIFKIPTELSSKWSNESHYEELIKHLYKDIEDTNIPSIYIKCFPKNNPTILRALCLKEKADIAKVIIDTALENEIQLSRVIDETNRTIEQVKDVQKKNKIFNVNKKFLGILIGKQGANIKNLKKQYNVEIIINSKYQNENSEAQVTISGEDANKVEQCTIEMNLVEKIYELKKGSEYQVQKILKKAYNQYQIKKFLLSYEDYKSEEGDFYAGPNVSVIGPKKYIDELSFQIRTYLNN